MSINVVPAGVEPVVVDAEAKPAALGSPLIDLRKVRARRIAELHLDLPVPRWDEGGHPQVVVRYRPLNQSKALTAVQKRQESKVDDWLMLANADQLVSACVGVYVKDGEKCFTLVDGAWTQFDPGHADDDAWVGFSGQRAPELADALGIDLGTTRDKSSELCRGLFFTDGDMTLALQAVVAWSSKATPEVEKAALGE